MHRPPLLITLLLASLAASGSLAMTAPEVRAERARIEAEHSAAQARCTALPAHEQGACDAQADGDRRVARAELRARLQPSPQHRYQVQRARAETDQQVAVQRCGALHGPAEDVCRQEAEAAFVTATENARVARAAAQPGQSRLQQNARVAQARKTATAQKQQARYQAAVQRCAQLPRSARAACTAQARERLGR
jgi:hypothetical protein